MTSRARAQMNRENARLSTGPKTEAGKKRSSQNAFRHGLYSKQVLLPHEDPDEFEQLRADLIEEHQPSTCTERLLVEEMAQTYWRIQRYRQLQDAGFEPGNLEAWIDGGLFAVLQRALASAERAFHRALTALSKTKERDEPAFLSEAKIQNGFVPAKTNEERSPAETSSTLGTEPGSGVPSGSDPSPETNGFVPKNLIAQLSETAKPAQPPSRMA